MQAPLDDEIDLLEYWNTLWRRKWMIISLCSVFVIVTMITSLLATKTYRSETVIIVSDSSMAGGLGAALSAVPLAGALAGAAGLQTPIDKIMVVLKSRTMSEAVIHRFNLLVLFNDDKWDETKKTWKDPAKPPFMQDAIKILVKKVVKIDKNRDGSVSIAVVWKDKKVAAEIANYYVEKLSEILNEKSIGITVQVIDKAIPADKKYRPIIRLNMMIAGVMSLFLGVFIAFFLEYLSKQKELSSKAGNGDGQASCHDEAAVVESRSKVSP